MAVAYTRTQVDGTGILVAVRLGLGVPVLRMIGAQPTPPHDQRTPLSSSR